MIWNNTPLMTLIDVVIILITAVSAGVILGQRRELVAAGALKPTLMLLAGWARRFPPRLNAGLAP